MSDVATRAVELAYPREIDGARHEADSVVELPTDFAKRLVREGRARWATAASPQVQAPPRAGAGSGRDAWVAHAQSIGVPVNEEMTRDDIAAAVEAASTTTTTTEG